MSKLVLYSASWCSNCPAMKLWLTQQGVSFITKDIDNVDSDELDSIGLRSIPALVRDGKTVGVGESIKEYVYGL